MLFEINRRNTLFLGLLFLFALTACQSDVVLPTEVAEVVMDEEIETAVAATVSAQLGGETGGENTAVPPATWTPIPVEDTPVSPATEPAPPTTSPVPTVTRFIPTNTPRPTETAVPPPTNTPAPAQPTSPPVPTSPPAPPTIPPAPVYGTNILNNGSFEDGWYHQNGIPELQLPNGWGFGFDEGATGFGSEPWDVWVRPETRVWPDYQIPPHERPLFIREGQFTIKMFKGNGAISFRLVQDIALEAGSYTFEINIYPDLVTHYNNDQKVFATDALSGEISFIAPDGGTGWILPAFGQWNTLTHTFTLTEAQTVRVGLAVRGRYAISNNGWFLDDWTLKRIEN